MKILFVTKAEKANYLRDTIFHGLISLGHEVIDSTYIWFMSDDITIE
jgi:hypothetical protein